MMRTLKIMAICGVLGITGCATNDPHKRTKTGAAIGAVAGAILGHQLDGKSGRYVGAAVGAAVGAGVGYQLDQQHQQLEALAEENEHLGLEVQRLQDGSIRLDIPSEVSFDVDSARIKRGFQRPLSEVAAILRQERDTEIVVVGHTDSTGSQEYNLELSEQRAISVADFLNDEGISPRRLLIDGRGESEPRASNATASGRRLNRRVEIFVRPLDSVS